MAQISSGAIPVGGRGDCTRCGGGAASNRSTGACMAWGGTWCWTGGVKWKRRNRGLALLKEGCAEQQ